VKTLNINAFKVPNNEKRKKKTTDKMKNIEDQQQ
jgi:hypothetical protein